MKKQIPRTASTFKTSTPNSLTILTSKAEQILGKVFKKKTSGDVEKSSYANEKYFRATSVEVGGLVDLGQVLGELEGKYNTSGIVRGDLTKKALRGEWIRRLSNHQKDGSAPTLKSAPKRWICLDIDDLPFPKDLDPHSPEDRIEAIKRLVEEHLPEEFHMVSFYYQWSSSFGVGENGFEKLKLHLWFWSSTPLTDWQLKAWLKNTPVDLALFSAAQIHYTAAPVFRGMDDPLGGERSGLVHLEASEIFPPEIATAPAKQPTPKQPAPAKRPQAAANQPITPTTKTTPKGRAILEKVKKTLASAPQGTRRLTLLRCGRYLGGWIREGEIALGDAEAVLRAGAESNGWGEKVGYAHLERTIGDSIGYGILNYIPRRIGENGGALGEDGITLEEAAEALKKLLGSTLSEISTDSLAALSIPPGVGKTHAALQEAISASQKGDTRVLLFPNHALAAEAKKSLEEMSGGQVKIVYMEGSLRKCRVYIEAPDNERPELREAVEEGGGIRILCGTKENLCPHAFDCPIFQGKAAATPKKGEIIIGVHAHAPYLKDLPESTKVIFDEAPNSLTYMKEIQLSDLKALIATESATTPISIIAEQLLLILEALPAYHGRYPQQLDTDILSSIIPLLKLLGKALEENPDQFTPPPLPNAKELRQGNNKNRGARRAWKLIVGLAASAKEEGISGGLIIRQSKNRIWLEHHTAITLPEYPTIVLDATAAVNKTRWEALAKSNGKDFKLHELIVKAPYINEASFIQTTSLRSSQLLNEEGEWRTRAVGAIKKALSILRRETSDLADGATLGIGTHKALADLIRSTLEGEKSTNPIALEMMSELKAFLDRFDVIVGHSGADDIGSNKFKDVDAFILLGTPRFDMGASAASLSALGIPKELLDQIYKEETRARLIQWISRARHIRRSGVKIIYFGDGAPPINSSSLVGLSWAFREITTGAAHTEAVDHAWNDAKERLSKGEILTAEKLITKHSISEGIARRILQEMLGEYPEMYLTILYDGGMGRPMHGYSLSAVSEESVQIQGFILSCASAYKKYKGGDQEARKQMQRKVCAAIFEGDSSGNSSPFSMSRPSSSPFTENPPDWIGRGRGDPHKVGWQIPPKSSSFPPSDPSGMDRYGERKSNNEVNSLIYHVITSSSQRGKDE